MVVSLCFISYYIRFICEFKAVFIKTELGISENFQDALNGLRSARLQECRIAGLPECRRSARRGVLVVTRFAGAGSAHAEAGKGAM
jgi:hypothetical protein